MDRRDRRTVPLPDSTDGHERTQRDERTDILTDATDGRTDGCVVGTDTTNRRMDATDAKTRHSYGRTDKHGPLTITIHNDEIHIWRVWTAHAHGRVAVGGGGGGLVPVYKPYKCCHAADPSFLAN